VLIGDDPALASGVRARVLDLARDGHVFVDDAVLVSGFAGVTAAIMVTSQAARFRRWPPRDTSNSLHLAVQVRRPRPNLDVTDVQGLQVPDPPRSDSRTAADASGLVHPLIPLCMKTRES
jgi:hypothetical protein